MGLLHPKHGRTATGRARIIDAKELEVQVGTGYAGFHNVGLHAKLSVRVTPDDGGPEFESQTKKWGGDQQHVDKRHETYVLYDPEHPEQCEIDLDRLEHEFGRGEGGKRRTVIPGWVTAERDAELKARADGTLKPGEKFDPAASIRTFSLGGDESAPAADSLAAELKDIVDMHASGALTDAEFAAAKARLLHRPAG